MNKCVFFDIDNTIYVTRKKLLRESVKNLFKQLKLNDYKVGISTGRPNSRIDMLNDVKDYIDYFVLSNGMFVRTNKEIVYEKFFELKHINDLIKLAQKEDVTLGFGSSTKSGLLYKAVSPYFEREDKDLFLFDEIKENIHTLWISSLDRDKIDKVYNIIKKHETLDVFKWNKNGMDISFKKHNKKTGVLKLITDQDYLIVAGDGENDYELLKIANKKIVVKTTKFKKLLSLADYTIETADSDELYNLFLNKIF